MFMYRWDAAELGGQSIDKPDVNNAEHILSRDAAFLSSLCRAGGVETATMYSQAIYFDMSSRRLTELVMRRQWELQICHSNSTPKL